MLRNTFIFLGTFVVGALIALVARAALFAPHAEHAGHPAAGGDYAAMVSNPLTPAPVAGADSHATPATSAVRAIHPAEPTAAASPAHHSIPTTPAVAANTDGHKPVNTLCAICGMDVDPALPTLEYQGQRIGFGCRMCPPKFQADPDRYGPAYLRNEVIQR